MTREELLKAATATVNGSREQDYGSPEDNFASIASLWSVYTGTTLTPTDVAIMMLLLKVARLKATPSHEDSWIDAAGYIACGAEIELNKGN